MVFLPSGSQLRVFMRGLCSLVIFRNKLFLTLVIYIGNIPYFKDLFTSKMLKCLKISVGGRGVEIFFYSPRFSKVMLDLHTNENGCTEIQASHKEDLCTQMLQVYLYASISKCT